MDHILKLLIAGTGLLFVISTIHGAIRVDANVRARDVMRRRRTAGHREGRALEEDDVNVSELLHLSKGEDMVVSFKSLSAQGGTVEKLVETYRSIPVYDATVTVKADNKGRLTGDASGEFIQGIDEDLPSVETRLSDEETLELAIREEGDDDLREYIRNVKIELNIFIDKQDKARLVNKVQYLAESGGNLKRPYFIIDATTGEILQKWNNIGRFNCGSQRAYKAYGGNEKIGKIKYGNRPFCLDMRKEGNTCFLENKYAMVIDMGGDTEYTRNESIQDTVASFKCKNAYEDEVNGAYSPAIDALFYGTMVGKMYEDWFQTKPLPHRIKLCVHYGVNFANAYWDGRYTVYGDGNDEMYSFVTSLDTVGHEVAHGVTEFGSDLQYFDEAGGMNEAFSDIMGEAAEGYVHQDPDFKGSDEIPKRGGKYDALSYFDFPEDDNNSIAHVKDMDPNLDPHFASGIYRRVFYVVVKQKNMPLRNAAHVFLHANRLYWHHAGTFYDCACGLLKSAVDLGFSTAPFERAFLDVGITPCDYTNHIFSLANNRTQTNVSVSSEVRPVFRFETAVRARNVTVVATGGDVPVQIVVQNGTWAEDEHGRPIDVIAEDVTRLDIEEPLSSEYFIQLSSASTIVQNINVVAYQHL